VLGAFELAALAWRIPQRNAAAPEATLDSLLLAHSGAAMAVVEDGERVVAANDAYRRLAGDGAAPLIPERLLAASAGGAQALGAFLRAVADGRAHDGTVEQGPGGRRFEVSVHPLETPRRTLWALTAQVDVLPVVAESAPAHAETAPVERAAASSAIAATPEENPWGALPAGTVQITGGWVTGANAAFLSLLDRPELPAEGIDLGSLVAPEHQARLKVVLAAARAPQSLAVDLLGKNGARLPVILRLAVARAGEAVGVVLPLSALPKGIGAAPAAPVAAPAIAPAKGKAGDAKAGEGDLFFQRAPLALARVDGGGVIRFANGAFERLFGFAGGGASRALPALVAERDQPDLAAFIAQAARDGTAADAASCDVTLAGPGNRSARFYAAPLSAMRAGGDVALCAIDTTAQKALEAQFTQSQKMEAVGHLAGGVAHDFNNLLTAIIGFCDLLIARHRQSDPSFPDIMQIKQNANRAADLVGQLLAFSRRQTLRPNVTQLTDVIADLSAMLRRLIGERITLEVSHGRGLWPVKVDANKFEQVVVNLAVNARDAMPDGGTLTLRTANVTAAGCAAYGSALAPGDYVLAEVEDTGTGIPPEVMDKIFEPFFSTKEVGKGTGLGLSTVYGIVQQTGGTILVASEEGRGTVFRVFLPRHVGEASGEALGELEAVPAIVVEEKATDLTGEGRVLLVEDEDAVRAFAARALSARGYEVIPASNGVEALSALERIGHVDLVVSDVVMPEMDGPSLLRELRARDPALKFVFMSGYAEDAFARNLARSEQFSFLPKPFSLKDLVGTVNAAIRG